MQPVPGLACPACRSELRTDGEAMLICDACGASYPVFDGIPSFVAPTLPSPASGGGDRRPQLTVLVSSPHSAIARERGGEEYFDGLLDALRLELRSLGV